MEILKKRILVIQTAFLGDCLLTVPFLLRLRIQNPEAEISLVTSAKTGQVFSSLKCIDALYILDKRGKHKSLLRTIEFAEEISRIPFDRLYSLHRSFRTTLFSFFVKAEEKLGFENASLSFLYNLRVPYKTHVHEIDRNLAFLGEEGFELDQTPEEFFSFTGEQETKVRDQIASIGAEDGKLIAIAPGSVWETKRYPAEYFREIASVLVNRGCKIAIIGGVEESELAERILSGAQSQNIFNLCGVFNILESILFLKKARMLLCNDSAPVHLGFLAGTPVLEIYCSTVPDFGFYPYGKNSGYISAALTCKPCGIHGHRACPVGTFDCAVRVTPQMVLDRIDKEFL
ncbi:MAG: glycosyltransferase family 9 protein [Ignavibacteriales bacterium]|nr:MAG: glycosyltransferase family 9 protein [Ignavibacteriales bacterium]